EKTCPEIRFDAWAVAARIARRRDGPGRPRRAPGPSMERPVTSPRGVRAPGADRGRRFERRRAQGSLRIGGGLGGALAGALALGLLGLGAAAAVLVGAAAALGATA